MATYPLVEPPSNDQLALAGLSLEKHGIPVTTRFWIRLTGAGQRKIVIVSPLVDKIGTRETFARIFDALEDENSATKQFLNSNILLLGTEESKEALDAIARGASQLPSLGPYEEIEISPVADADHIEKPGFLYFAPSSDDCVISFTPVDGSGSRRIQSIPKGAIGAFLERIPASEADRKQVMDDLKQGRSTNLLTRINLRELYDMGLV